MANTISAETLQATQDPLKLPVAPVDTGIDSQQLMNSTLGSVQDLTNQVAQREQALTESGNSLQNVQALLGGIDQERANMESQANIQSQKQDVLNASNQLNTLAKQAQAIPLKYEGQTGGERTLGGIEPLQTADLRRNTIQALTISADLQAKQGNLALAQSQIDSAINLKYKNLENQLALKKQAYEMNKDALEKVDKKRADALNFTINKQEKELAEKKKNEQEINTMITEAIPNAPASIVANARKLAESGASKLAVAQALGKYGGDYLKSEMLKEQIKTEKAQQANYYANIAKTNAEAKAAGAGSTLKALTEGQAKDLTYAQRADQSETQINRLESKISSMSGTEYLKQKALEGNALTSGSASNEIKQYRQAQRNFITAILRRESGATISDTEFATAEKQYFPQPGDDTQTLLQKKNARNTAIKSFKQNVPNYAERTATAEDDYLDKQALPAVAKVSEKVDNPISSYRMKLQGLPGTQ